jgi:hypothetical protein
MEQISLKEIQRRASLFYGDGLIDIGIGLGVVMLGVVLVLGLGVYAGACVIALLSVIRSMRRRITFPRMYHLDFMPDPYSEPKVHRVATGVTVAVAVVILACLLALPRAGFLPVRLAAWLRGNPIIEFSLVIAGTLLVVAWGTGARRLFTYAAITFVALVCGNWFNADPAYYFMALGLVMLFGGSMVLARFVRKYPRIER